MTHLKDKLRAAECGSRELDADIWEALGKCAHRETEYYAVQSDTGFTCKGCKIDLYGVSIPRLSTSIDAALSLIEEVLPGHGWGRYPELGIMFLRSAKNGNRFDGGHRSPAIALILALLDALAAKETGDA